MKEQSLRYYLIKNVLSLMNEKFTLHGIRVAYIMLKMYECEGRPLDEKVLNLIETCIYHDIGAYKTEEAPDVLRLGERSMFQHSTYGYLFLKHLSTLDEYSEIILHHHLKYERKGEYSFAFLDETIRVHLADRIDVVVLNGNTDDSVMAVLNRFSGEWFDPKDVDLFIRANKRYHILENLRDGDYEDDIVKLYSQFQYDRQGILDILKMLVHSIDFHNEETVIHTVASAVMAKRIGMYYNLSGTELEETYIAALIHDVGKIGMPTEILKSRGRLTDEEREVMKSHVYTTKKIIDGYMDEKVVNIAVRHHERSDGSGYPLGLTEERLTLQDKIVAVADVVSAMNEKRLYKGKKTKREVLKILNGMAEKNEFDSEVVQVVVKNYDEIIKEVVQVTKGVVEKYKNLVDDYNRFIQQSKRMSLDIGRDKTVEGGVFDDLQLTGATLQAPPYQDDDK